jgi:heptosyltransferase-2
MPEKPRPNYSQAMKSEQKILVIQTASIGDVILSTPVLESLHASLPGARIDILLKAGCDDLFRGHPFIGKIHVWDKHKARCRQLIKILSEVRREKYDQVINIQRFFSSGLVTACSGASHRAGFSKNPWSFLFHRKVKHEIGLEGLHEVDRNLSLLEGMGVDILRQVRIYPSEMDESAARLYKDKPYICVAPASLWFTKQYPAERWSSFLGKVDPGIRIYLLGSSSDTALCNQISTMAGRQGITVLSGKLNLLETASLMKDALMNYVNDSAPLHLASAMNAPVTAVFCSTVPRFGFGPLSDDSAVVETGEDLGCRPCGLHGYPSCPEKHFRCALTIDENKLLSRLPR